MSTSTIQAVDRAPVAISPGKSRRRILFINHVAKMSGGEIALLNLVAHLDRRKYEPIILLFEEGPLANSFREMGETFVLPLDQAISTAKKDNLGIRSALEFGTLFRLLSFTWKAARFIRRQNVDLVHTNSLKSDLIGGIAGRLAGRPVIWHVRDRISNDYLPPLVVKAFRFFAKVLPTHVIAISGAVARTITPKVDLRRVQSGFTVVHDGTELEHAIFRPSTAIRRFGLIGRISPWKGQDVFIRAAAHVHHCHPETRFLMIGASLFGESHYEEEIRSLAKELAIEHAVEFAGHRTDIPEQIANLDVVVHASTTGEPFGQVIIEGMAAGKPVIATRGGGVPEIIEDGVNGLLVPMNDSNALARAMIQMIDNPGQALAMGSLGRKTVEDSFRIDFTAEKVEAVFEKILE